MNRTGREIRSALCEVRAAPEAQGNGLTFSGYAARYGTYSEDMGFLETIAPGAFAEVIGRDDVRCLVNHDMNRVLGRTKSGTLTLEDRPDGLFFVANAPDTQWARDFAESVRRGDVDQCSFGFQCIKDIWTTTEDGKQMRTILSIDPLYDVSIVTYPAYQQTEVSVRSARDVLEAHMRASGAPEKRKSRAILKRKIEIMEKEM